MELCAGTLDDVIRGEYNGPPIGKRRQVLRQIISGLEYLSGENIVYGFLGSHNILISIPSDGKSPLIKLNVSNYIFNEFILTNEPSSYPEKKNHMFSAGICFAYFLSDGMQNEYVIIWNLTPLTTKKNRNEFITNDFTGDEKALELIEFMLHPANNHTPTQVLERIELLQDCWNFALGKLTGCDSCTEPSPHFLGSGKFATVFKGKYKGTKQRTVSNDAIKRK